MKIIVINSKGGVGKSTTAGQVIAPYLYQKNDNKKVNLIEYDDENKDSLSFQESDIFTSKQVKITGNNLAISISEEALNNDNIVVDIGGNKTTTYILNSLKESGMINAFDLVIIPMMDGEQDCINAINVYEKIREVNKDIKIVFMLSRVNGNYAIEMQYFDFYGDKKGFIDDRKGLIEKIDKNDRNIIKLYDSEVVKYSRAFGKTIYEMCDKDKEELSKELKSALKNKDDNESKKLSYKLTILNKAIRYRDEVLEECFKEIDKVIA